MSNFQQTSDNDLHSLGGKFALLAIGILVEVPKGKWKT